MRALSSQELLDAWERGSGQSPPERALTLLAASTGEGRDVLARLTVGERDRRLLTLRERTFGPRLSALAVCARCGERLEMTFDVADVTVSNGGEVAAEAMSLSVGGYRLKFRAPTSLDLLELAPARDPSAARRALFARCLLSAERGGEDLTAERLPEEVVAAVVDAMAEADPQADVELALACPRCGNAWKESLDVCAFLWGELSAWAVRTLGEVHTLARAYGWGEGEILSMSAWRRQFYLKLVGG